MGGENRCSMWHQDAYVARAFVTYCGAGTEYTEDANVNFELLGNLSQLNNGKFTEADNAQLIKNTSAVKSVGVGDILLIKGLKFPGKSGGLVHKSPPVEYYPDGRVKHRLCLKVDISKFKARRETLNVVK